jgi:hypothetical protein
MFLTISNLFHSQWLFWPCVFFDKSFLSLAGPRMLLRFQLKRFVNKSEPRVKRRRKLEALKCTLNHV